MAKVSLTLDGKAIEVEAGSTILKASSQGGVAIPTLCHDPRLKPYAACRICLVEVQGARGFLPACATPVQEGMVVKTKTDNLTEIRKAALELLLSDHYGDCIAPCKQACPAEIDIQGFIGLIAIGEYEEALKLIKESNPLPLVCGRVCPRFCETKCRRNRVDEPLAINALKRFVADLDLSDGGPYTPAPKLPTGHKVAIVGGGPAGLSAAYYLALEGHEVDIFEASPQLGGMLRYGIPEYRLPKTILDQEIAAITRLCRQVQCNSSLGRDFTIESLKASGYEAIFLSLGAQASQRIGAEGEDLPGVLSGIGFLRDVIMQKEIRLGKKVAVIGGGNTAVDAARTALRLGAGEITIVYRRSREEMPANNEEIEEAEREGVEILFLAAPTRLIAQNGRVSSLECIRMALGEPDSSGRRRPNPIKGSEFIIGVDTVIAAIGQTLDATGLPKGGPAELVRRGAIVADKDTLETPLSGIFSGGDCVTGPATAVEAIAAGRKAAAAIGQYLSGQAVTPPTKPFNITKGEWKEIDIDDFKDVARVPRTKMRSLGLEGRKGNFVEVELGFNEDMARREAERCLTCGCLDVYECELRKLATDHAVTGKRYPGRKRHLPIKKEEHPHILRDPNKCILCGRCVRICSEVQGVGALGFIGRGFDTAIKPLLDMPLLETSCESCSQCISTCPTGALTDKTCLAKPGPWKTRAVPSVCPYCGIGCNIDLQVIGNKIVKTTAPVGGAVNQGNLCKRGAYDYCRDQGPNRLTTPLVKRDGYLVKATWDEALARASRGLRQIRDRNGEDKLAVLASPQLTNEESYLAQKLARTALGTNNIGSFSSSVLKEALAECFGANASTCSYRDLLTTDLIFTFGCDLTEDYPIIALKMREAVGKGTRLAMVHPRATRMDPLAQIALKVNPRASVALIRAMLNYIVYYDLADHDFVRSRTTGFGKFAREMRRYRLEDIANMLWIKPSKVIELIHLYIRARRPVIIVDADRATSAELTLISDLALITGNVGRDGSGIIALRTPGNAQGHIDMGISPHCLPGHQPLSDKHSRQRFEAAWQKPLPPKPDRDATGIIAELKKGDILGILAIGTAAAGEMRTAIFDLPIFSVLIATSAPEKPPYPDVVLPGATFAETEGTYTNCERRIQHTQRATTSPSGRENWQILCALATALGYPMNYPSVSDITAEIIRLVPSYQASADGGQWSFLDNDRFRTRDGLAHLHLAASVDAGAMEASHSLL